jgi:hypothetical protein
LVSPVLLEASLALLHQALLEEVPLPVSKALPQVSPVPLAVLLLASVHLLVSNLLQDRAEVSPRQVSVVAEEFS